jgi:hypothetical protein
LPLRFNLACALGLSCTGQTFLNQRNHSPPNFLCQLKDKGEPFLIDLKDKSERLPRGAKLSTIVLHVK